MVAELLLIISLSYYIKINETVFKSFFFFSNFVQTAAECLFLTGWDQIFVLCIK